MIGFGVLLYVAASIFRVFCEFIATMLLTPTPRHHSVDLALSDFCHDLPDTCAAIQKVLSATNACGVPADLSCV